MRNKPKPSVVNCERIYALIEEEGTTKEELSSTIHLPGIYINLNIIIPRRRPSQALFASLRLFVGTISYLLHRGHNMRKGKYLWKLIIILLLLLLTH